MARRPAPKNRPRIARITQYTPATGGWIASQNLTDPADRAAQGLPQAAYVMENIFPTASGAELRRGSIRYATIGDGSLPVLSFMRYKNGSVERLFAANQSAVYDITSVLDPTQSPPADITGMTSGRWSSVQFSTTGGVFLVAVNGANAAQVYNGAAWSAASTVDVYELEISSPPASPFQPGETITGQVSGATSVVSEVRNSSLVIGAVTEGIGTFAIGETVSGDMGGSATVQFPPILIISGVDIKGGTATSTADFSYVWSYKNRLFFIQEDTLDAYYMDLDSIGGDVTWFPMGGVFPLGGALMFGAAWSMDTSGSGGLSEQCIFVTTEGEIAVYQGTNPSDANAWSKVGLYRIGKPLGPNSWVRSGGDIIVATDIGFVSVSAAIRRDVVSLSPSASSYPIETAWNDTVTRKPVKTWSALMWPENQMVLVAPPKTAGYDPEMLVANARTGAWCKFTNWEGNCLATAFGRLFWGADNGAIIEGGVSGADIGEPYTGRYLTLFDSMQAYGSRKIPHIARATIRANSRASLTLNIHSDYIVEWPPVPAATVIGGGAQWGSAVWGESVWGGGIMRGVQTDWTSVSGSGYALAVGLQVTSGNSTPLDMEIVRIDVTFDTADIVS